MKTPALLLLLFGLASAASAMEPDTHPIATLGSPDSAVRLAAGAMATRAAVDSRFNCESRMGCEVGGIVADYAGSDRLAGGADFEGYVPYVGMEFGRSARDDDSVLTRVGVIFTSRADSEGCAGRCESAPEYMHKDFDTVLTGASLRPTVRVDWAFRF